MGITLKYALAEGWEQPSEKGYPKRQVSDVAVDSRDRVYLYTREGNEIVVFDRDGRYVKTWGHGKFLGRAHGIFVGPDDSVYCVNDLEQTIRKFTPDGELLMTIGTPGVCSDTGYDRTLQGQDAKNASIKRSAPPFNRPTRLAVAPDGKLYVTDGYGNARVHRFSAEGKLEKSWGNPGSGPGEFMVPHGIGIASDGRVVVADRDNDRIQIFTRDGEFLEEWANLSRPTSLFIRSGLVYITETGWAFDPEAPPPPPGNRDMPMLVSVLDEKGDVVARWDYEVPPHGISADSRGDIYVASNNRRGRVDGGATPKNYSLLKFALQP